MTKQNVLSLSFGKGVLAQVYIAQVIEDRFSGNLITEADLQVYVFC